MKKFLIIVSFAVLAGCGAEKVGADKPTKKTPDYWASHTITLVVSATKGVEDFNSFYLIGQSDESVIFAADSVMDCEVRVGGIRFVDAIMSTAPITPKGNGIVTFRVCQDVIGVVNDRFLFINGHPITATTDKGNALYQVKLCDPDPEECPKGIVWYNPETTTAEDDYVVSLTTASNKVLAVLGSYMERVTEQAVILGGLEYLASFQPVTYTVQPGYLAVRLYDATGNTSKILDCTMSSEDKIYATVNGKTSLLGQCNDNALYLRIDNTGDSWPVGLPVIFKKEKTSQKPSTTTTTPATDDTVNPGNGELNLAPNQVAINFSTTGSNGVSVSELHCWNYVNPTTPHDAIFGNWENLIAEGQNYVYTNGTALQCNAKLSNGQWYVEKSGIKFNLAKIKVSLPDVGVSFWLDSSDLWVDNGVNGGNLAFLSECQDTNSDGKYDTCSLKTVNGTVIQ